MTVTKHLAEAEAIVGAENVALDEAEEGRTVIAASPGSAAEVAGLVRYAGENDMAIVPMGTGMQKPAKDPVAGRGQLRLSLSRMSHILRLDETSLVVHVQAGLTAIELEQILSKRGLSLGDYPPSALRATIGGLLAVRTPGKLSRRHGFIEDAVLGLSAVLPDGRTIYTRVAPRRATGPDLARAICGSEGTLGVITSAVLRIHRRPEARFLAAYGLPTFDDAISAVSLSLREEAAPAAMGAYDKRAIELHTGAELNDYGAVLLVATAGPTDLAACDRDLVASAVSAFGGAQIDSEIAEGWWQDRISAGKSETPPHLQVSATLGKQKAVYKTICEALGEGRVCGYGSRFDLDGGVLFLTMLSEAGERLEGPELSEATGKVLEAAREAGAYLLGATTSELDPYFQSLRAALDPNGVLNPGALLDTSVEETP